MKRLAASLMLAVLLLTACASQLRTDVTQEEIVAAYEAAGYNVWSRTYEEKLEYGKIGYVQANHPNGDYIYFAIFESEEAARAYKKEFPHPILTGVFSSIFGVPSWQRCKVHGTVVVEYDEPDYYKPFVALLQLKNP